MPPELAEGRFGKDEFNKTRRMLVDRIRSREDSPSSLIGSFAEMLRNGRPFSPGEMLEKIESVDHEDVVRVSSRVHLSTIYFLRGAE